VKLVSKATFFFPQNFVLLAKPGGGELRLCPLEKQRVGCGQ
jgi:hypothetical protein